MKTASHLRILVSLVVLLPLGLLGAACTTATAGHNGEIVAVGAESQYADVISQIGGRYVDVTALLRNPNTDPHTFEASPSVARTVSDAELVVQNGARYDSFINTIEAASPNGKRKVVNVQELLGFAITTSNPHLWYEPKVMPVVARAIERDLSALEPSHRGYFRQRLASFERSLAPWLSAIARFRAEYRHVAVATTEPVANYMLQAVGVDDKTPFALQADIMNGVDPAPQDITLEDNLLRGHKVKALVYNEQVADSVTESFLAIAKASGIPVVGVYETMPTPGYDYQSWMLAEVHALERAVAERVSTERL
jgi:zinc/manganese transport system substrate-binding protein